MRERAVDLRITERVSIYARILFQTLKRHLDVDGDEAAEQDYELWVRRSIEESFERLVVDSNVQGPERLLLRQVRHCFPMASLPTVVVAVNETIGAAVEFLESPQCQELLNGRCLASTRDGEPCRRPPVTSEDYCPSHRHLQRAKDRANGNGNGNGNHGTATRRVSVSVGGGDALAVAWR